MAVWDRIFVPLAFVFLVPVGIVILAMSIVEGEGELLGVGCRVEEKTDGLFTRVRKLRKACVIPN